MNGCFRATRRTVEVRSGPFAVGPSSATTRRSHASASAVRTSGLSKNRPCVRSSKMNALFSAFFLKAVEASLYT